MITWVVVKFERDRGGLITGETKVGEVVAVNRGLAQLEAVRQFGWSPKMGRVQSAASYAITLEEWRLMGKDRRVVSRDTSAEARDGVQD